MGAAQRQSPSAGGGYRVARVDKADLGACDNLPPPFSFEDDARATVHTLHPFEVTNCRLQLCVQYSMFWRQKGSIQITRAFFPLLQLRSRPRRRAVCVTRSLADLALHTPLSLNTTRSPSFAALSFAPGYPGVSAVLQHRGGGHLRTSSELSFSHNNGARGSRRAPGGGRREARGAMRLRRRVCFTF